MACHFVSQEHLAFSRSLRSKLSAAEEVIRDALRDRRLDRRKFRRQFPVGMYVADFICLEARLIIETDGPLHESEDARSHDAKRDAWLRRKGFHILRLQKDLILGAPELAVAEIKAALLKTKQPLTHHRFAMTPSPARGEGR